MIVGYDFSGRVDAVGEGVESLRAGDEVFGFVPYSPSTRWGTFAEHLARKPAGVSHETAAAAAAVGLTTAQPLRKPPGCGPGTRVLVTGASGGVGSVAIGIVRALGGQADAVSSAAHRDFVLDCRLLGPSGRGVRCWRQTLAWEEPS
jgi:NADPH:quinone reductase-like Zn-dependent oxidoreductase